MRKRERENPCGVCGHYHKYEEGEVCGICGHRMPATSERSGLQTSAFPSEIIPDFLYLGSYDNASRAELLKTQGISRVLNTVPACQNLYKNSFTYHCLKDEEKLPFGDAIQFIGALVIVVSHKGMFYLERLASCTDQCEKDKARVLVHCMSGRSRSPAVVIAYLMKCKGWSLSQSYQWVKDRRPSVELTAAVYQQLQEYEQSLFGTCTNGPSPLINSELASLKFGFPATGDALSAPLFNEPPTSSIFDRENLNIPPHGFTFGTRDSGPLGVLPPNGTDAPMDSS